MHPRAKLHEAHIIMTIAETLYSFVNRWECDENDHLNVQYYFSRFEEADRQFQLISGLNEALVGARRVRHVRYHKELRTGDLIVVRSAIAFDGPHMLTAVHEMYDVTTDTLKQNVGRLESALTQFRQKQVCVQAT